MIFLLLKFQSLELLFTYIHLSLASLSVLLKHKSLIFGNFSLLLHEISIFWLKHIYILSKLQRSALNMLALWCKLAFIAEIFLKMCSWCMKIPSQFYFFAIWCILASALSIIAWKAPSSGWSPSELAMFV